MSYPVTRLRRLRSNALFRDMARETAIGVGDLICPLFVVHGEGVKEEIEPLPGNFHLSVDRLSDEVKEIRDFGIPAVLLFGIPGGVTSSPPKPTVRTESSRQRFRRSRRMSRG